MVLQKMTNAIPFSPVTTVVSMDEVSSDEWELTVDSISAFPSPPGFAVITKSDNAGYRSNNASDYETIMYEEIDGNILKQITREIEGTQQTWESDDFIAAFWTAEAYNRIKNNIEEISENYLIKSYYADESPPENEKILWIDTS